MPQADDSSRSLVPFQQDATLVAVIEMSQSSWLVAATVPGVDRQPRKKIVPDETALLRLLLRWRDEAIQSGRTIARITVAYEAGRDGFWLARWLIGHDIEAHVIHPTSVAVSREHKRAKTDRLDTAMLIRVFIGWLRGERGHCGMVAVLQETGERPHEIGQRQGPTRPDPVRLAVPPVPEGQRPGAMVPQPNRRAKGSTQDQDGRRARPQASRRALAHGNVRGNPAGRRPAPGDLTGHRGV